MTITVLDHDNISALTAPERLGGALHEARISRGLSQSALALQIGRSRKWVSDVERGIGSAGVDSIAQAATALGLSLQLTPENPLRFHGASLPGSLDRANEDAWGASQDLAWVIDGATQPAATVQSFTASEYARALSAAIRERAAMQRPLAEILEEAIREAAAWPRNEAGPAATVAVVRRCGPGIEWLVLGDAGVMLKPSPRSKTTVIRDDRLAHVAVEERRNRRQARAAGATPAKVERLSQDLYRAELAARNVEGGYWIASADQSAARHAMTGYSDVSGPVYLATDGVLDAIGSAGPWTNADDAIRAWADMPPEEIVARSQRTLSSAPGSKVDDATVVELT